MKPSDFLGLLGGLALFLYGMQMMSGGLEAAAGNRMKRILERLTANRILGECDAHRLSARGTGRELCGVCHGADSGRCQCGDCRNAVL